MTLCDICLSPNSRSPTVVRIWRNGIICYKKTKHRSLQTCLAWRIGFEAKLFRAALGVKSIHTYWMTCDGKVSMVSYKTRDLIWFDLKQMVCARVAACRSQDSARPTVGTTGLWVTISSEFFQIFRMAIRHVRVKSKYCLSELARECLQVWGQICF